MKWRKRRASPMGTSCTRKSRAPLTDHADVQVPSAANDQVLQRQSYYPPHRRRHGAAPQSEKQTQAVYQPRQSQVEAVSLPLPPAVVSLISDLSSRERSSHSATSAEFSWSRLLDFGYGALYQSVVRNREHSHTLAYHSIAQM